MIFFSKTVEDVAKFVVCSFVCMKVRNRAKIRNRYNQAPHQDTNGRVTASQVDTTNENPFTAGDHKASTDVHESITKQDRNKINDPQKKHQ